MRDRIKRRIFLIIVYYIASILDIAVWLYMFIRINLDSAANSNALINYFVLGSFLLAFAVYVLTYNSFMIDKKSSIIKGDIIIFLMCVHPIISIFLAKKYPEFIVKFYKSAFEEELPAVEGIGLQTQIKCCGWDNINEPAGGNICLYEITCHNGLLKWLDNQVKLITASTAFLIFFNLIIIFGSIKVIMTIPPPPPPKQKRHQKNQTLESESSNEENFEEDYEEEEEHGEGHEHQP